MGCVTMMMMRVMDGGGGGGEGRAYHKGCNQVQLSVFIYWLSVSMSILVRVCCAKFESYHVWVMEGD